MASEPDLEKMEGNAPESASATSCTDSGKAKDPEKQKQGQPKSYLGFNHTEVTNMSARHQIDAAAQQVCSLRGRLKSVL